MSDDQGPDADTQIPVDTLHQLVRQCFERDARLLRHWTLAGGVSAITTAFEVRDAAGTVTRYVVRVYGERDVTRNPRVGEHEFRLLEHLGCAGLPVPRPVYLHEPGEVFDGPAIVIGYIEGELIGDPSLRAQYLDQFTTGLVRIHNLELDSIDFSFLDGTRNDLTEPVEAKVTDTALAGLVADTLMERWPVKSINQPVLLHGDYWRGNLIWRDGKLVGILDWEDASIGEPLADVARARAELYWSVSPEACDQFTDSYLDHRPIDSRYLPLWDLRMVLGLAREMPNWGLTPERQGQATRLLEQFVRRTRENVL